MNRTIQSMWSISYYSTMGYVAVQLHKTLCWEMIFSTAVSSIKRQ